jgi:hypothetical protein
VPAGLELSDRIHSIYEVFIMKSLAIVAAVAGGLLLQSAAFAGYNANVPVVVGSTYAYGGLHDARNSADTKQYIGCYVGAYVSSYTQTYTTNYVTCTASDSKGNYYYCYSNNAPYTWVQLAAGLNQASYIYFYGDAQHHCLSIDPQNASSYL